MIHPAFSRWLTRTRLMALMLPLMIVGILGSAHHTRAASTVPARHVYDGHLLDSDGHAVTSSHAIRFSFWTSTDFVSTDRTATGAINTSAAHYVAWNEVHTVTPDGQGYFSIELGSIVDLPDLSTLSSDTLKSLFLQVEVKQSSDTDTAYELLDVDSNDAAKDRGPVDSLPFARNTDLLDQHDTGTGSDSIPVLQSGGLLPVSTVPDGTNRDFFTIDADDSASESIGLTFGTTLGKTLSYDLSENRFNFNGNVNVQGNLTVTGFINGVDVTSLSSAQNTQLRVSSGGGLRVNVAGGNYRVNGESTNFTGTSSVILSDNADNYLFFTSTGLTLATAFPNDKSFIPLAKVTTSGGAVTSLTDRRVLQADDRQDTVLHVLHPEYDGAAFQADASDNIGQLSLSFDNINEKNYYVWTSSKSSSNDYDILIRYTLPLDFHHWRESLFLDYRSTSADAANNALSVFVYDTNGNPVTLSGSTTGLANTDWTKAHIEFSGTPTWTGGQTMVIRVKLSAKSDYQMHIGDLELDYVQVKEE